MTRDGIAGVCRRKFVTTTIRSDDRQAPDLVERNFTAAAPYRLWRGPTSPNIPTWAGFLYLAVVLDVYSRRIVGWSMATSLAAQLVLGALNMALRTRRPKGVIHNAGQGSQYTSIAFGQRCRDAGVRPSMGSVGDAYDNACARASSQPSNASCSIAAGSRRRPKPEARYSPSSKVSTIRVVVTHRSAISHRSTMSARIKQWRFPDAGQPPACRRARGRQGQALWAPASGGRP